MTTVGFQKGAVEYAQKHGIGLKVIRPPKEDDWAGRIRRIVINVNHHTPIITACEVTPNAEWVKANFPDLDADLGAGEHVAALTKVRDLKTGIVEDINALWHRAMRENPAEEGQEGHGVLRWEDARFERPNGPPLRIDAIEFRWKFRVGNSKVLQVQHDPDAIVRDALAGTLLFVDTTGRVTGDVDEELGSR